MIAAIKKYIHSQQFNPGLMGIWLNPFYFARKELHREIGRFAPKIQGRVLDVGCGTKPYCELFLSTSGYIGLEIDTPENRVAKRADFFMTGIRFRLKMQAMTAQSVIRCLSTCLIRTNFSARFHGYSNRVGICC